ncbi:hypothetical protein SAMN04488168_11388 [Bacillus sp. 491mf]|nr:hypothetical protein SAMN04488168_11388 [Bacillus sp. 491mf]
MQGLFHAPKTTSKTNNGTAYVHIYLFFPHLCKNKVVRGG